MEWMKRVTLSSRIPHASPTVIRNLHETCAFHIILATLTCVTLTLIAGFLFHSQNLVVLHLPDPVGPLLLLWHCDKEPSKKKKSNFSGEVNDAFHSAWSLLLEMTSRRHNSDAVVCLLVYGMNASCALCFFLQLSASAGLAWCIV